MFPVPNFAENLKKSVQQFENQQNHNPFNLPNHQNSNAMLFNLTKNYLNDFENMNREVNFLKNLLTGEDEREELNKIQMEINYLSNLAFNTEHSMQNTQYHRNINSDIENLKKRMQELQQKHENLRQEHEQLKERVNRMEASMVTIDDFQRLEQECSEKFQFFNDQVKMLKDENNKLYIYVDQKFEQTLKPSEKFTLKLQEYSETNFKQFQYARRLYWGLMNQILAYRALSTGLVSKGYVKSKFREFGDIFGEATNLLGNVPVIGGFLNTVKDISSMFFNKQDEIIIHNMSKRVEGYFMEQSISEDVIEAVILLAEHPAILRRLSEFKDPQNPSGLEKFIKLIEYIIQLPDLFMSKIVEKIVGIKKDDSDSGVVSENIVTDVSFIVWKMVSEAPFDQQRPVFDACQKYIESIKEDLGPLAEEQEGPIPQSSERQKYFKVELMKAELTNKKQLFGRMNPYCVIKYGAMKQRTEVAKKQDLSPVWNHLTVLESTPITSAIIFEVFDAETFGSDDFLGEGSLVDSQYSEEYQEVKLYENGMYAGKLHVKLHP